MSINVQVLASIARWLETHNKRFPQDHSTWPEFASLARQVATRFNRLDAQASKFFRGERKSATEIINSWAGALEKAIAEKEKQASISKPKSTKTTKRTTKKSSSRRKR